MKYDTHIVIDFEMNPVAKRHREVKAVMPREIIEIGAVKINDRYEIVDKFRCYVKPIYNTAVNSTVSSMTGIHFSDLEYAPLFEVALGQLSDWIGHTGRNRIYGWSSSDYIQVSGECSYKQIPLPSNMTRWLDLQRIYQRLMGLEGREHQQALHMAAAQFGIAMDYKNSHSALYDAEITTELLIPILTGSYQEQAALLRSSISEEESHESFTLGDVAGGLFDQLRSQLKSSKK